MDFLKTRGEKIFFVLFLACACTGAVLLSTSLVFQMGTTNVGSILLSGTDTVKVSNGRILIRKASEPAGYYLYDNTTFEQLGARYMSTGWMEYHRFAFVGDLVYSTSSTPNRGAVEFWNSSNAVQTNASINFLAGSPSVCVQGNYAYFGLANQSVAIVNVSLAPSSLTFVNATPAFGFSPEKVMIKGSYLYARSNNAMAVCNVSNFTNLGTPQSMLGKVRDFEIHQNYLYTVGPGGNLSIYDISSPLAPVRMGDFTNVTQDIVRELEGICITKSGSQVLALIWTNDDSDGSFYVVDVTSPAAPVVLGVKDVMIGGYSGSIWDITADAERVYVAMGVGVAIISKGAFTPIHLRATWNAGALSETLASACFVFLMSCPVWGAGFLWKRNKRVAGLTGNDQWITGGTIIRTVVLFALILVIAALLAPSMGGMSSIELVLYSLPAVILFSLIPLYLYWKQHRLAKLRASSGADLSKDQLLEQLQAEKTARLRAEEETRRKDDEERKKRDAEKEAKLHAKEDAKRRQAEEEARKKHEQEEARMRKLQQIVKVSARLPIDRIAQMLEMDAEEVWKRVLDWAERFHFTIDGQDLIFNKETVNEFISSLDKEFKQWGKDGKV